METESNESLGKKYVIRFRGSWQPVFNTVAAFETIATDLTKNSINEIYAQKQIPLNSYEVDNFMHLFRRLHTSERQYPTFEDFKKRSNIDQTMRLEKEAGQGVLLGYITRKSEEDLQKVIGTLQKQINLEDLVPFMIKVMSKGKEDSISASVVIGADQCAIHLNTKGEFNKTGESIAKALSFYVANTYDKFTLQYSIEPPV